MQSGLNSVAIDTQRHLEALYILAVAFCGIRRAGAAIALRYYSPFVCGYCDRILLQDPNSRIFIVCGNSRGRDFDGYWRQDSCIVGCNESFIGAIGLLRWSCHARRHRIRWVFFPAGEDALAPIKLSMVVI
jgi:hypothetical protein